MPGRGVVITGATSGLGLALAKQVARRGARLILCGRDETGAATAAHAVRKATGVTVATAHGDLGAPAGIADLAARIAEHGSIDLLVNNAGAAFAGYEENHEGFERTVWVNNAAPLLLTALLRPQLSADSLVVSVSSTTVDHVTLDEPEPDVRGHNLATDYTQLEAYGTSKLLHLLALRCLAQRPATPFGIAFFDPGGIQTDFAAKGGEEAFLAMTKQHWDRMNTPDQAATHLLTILDRPQLSPAALYDRNGERALPAQAERGDLCASVYLSTRHLLPGVGALD